MNCFTDDQVARITHLVNEIEKLSDVEKLFLYLQLPCGQADKEDFANKHRLDNNNGRNNIAQSNNRTNFSDLFTKKPDQETTQTYTWILSHLEVDPNVSLPKQEVYDEYRAFCQANRFEPLCVADFGKAMKHAFPCIKPRRLGQRGNSRYCYSGLRKKYRLQPPSLPDLLADVRQPATQGDSNTNGTLGSSTHYSLINKPAVLGSDQPASQTDPRATQTDCTVGYEVMNLKVEAPSESSGASRLFYASMCGFKNGLEPGCLLTSGLDPDGANKQQPPTSGSNQVAVQAVPVSLTDANSLLTQHPILLGQPNQELTQNQCSPGKRLYEADLNELSSVRYNFQTYNQPQIVHPLPPRSPDDDDYRHNYQDMLPAIHRMSSSGEARFEDKTSLIATSQPPLTTNVNGFTYNNRQAASTCNPRPGFAPHNHEVQNQANLPSKPSVGQNTNLTFAGSDGHAQPVANVRSAHNSLGSTELGQQASLGQQQGLAMANSQHLHHLATFAGAHMDSCASPFQSPASTPYPGVSSGGFVSHDLIDYCSDDCLRYQN